MGCRQCLPLSVVQLKGKHCRKPHCRNEVVGMFGPYHFWKNKRQRTLACEYSCKSIMYYYTIQQATFIWQFWFWKLRLRSHDNMIGLEWCKFTKIYKESHTQSDNILGILGRIWKLLSQFNVHIGGNPYRYVVIFFARIESKCDLGWGVSAVGCR